MSKKTKYMTPVFRVSFPNLFKPTAYEGQAERYSVQAIWTPKDFSQNDKAAWDKLIAGMNEECKAAFKTKWDDLAANYKKGIRDGEEKAGMNGYGPGTKFATLSSTLPPGVVNLDNSPISALHGNTDLIYPGCYARAVVTMYTFNKKSKGIALGLSGLQFIRDGERIDDRTDVSDEFANSDLDAHWRQADEHLTDEENAF